MAQVLPPPPVNDKPGSFAWLEWYRQLRNYVSTSGSVPWFIINFAGSNITDIALRDHNQMQNLQGGGSNEQYHLTVAQVAGLLSSSEKTDLTDAGSSALHYHSTDRDRANHTGTQAVGTITGLATVATTGAYSDLSGAPTVPSIQTARVTTGSVAGASTALVTVTWSSAFADTNYTVQASVLDSTTTSLALSVVHVESITASAITVRVINNAVGALTGTIHATAIHD